MDRASLADRTAFFHFRLMNGYGRPHSCGGVTVAVRQRNGRLFGSAAICALGDNYSRRLGRLISEGRLQCTRHGHDRIYEDRVLRDGERIGALCVGDFAARVRTRALRQSAMCENDANELMNFTACVKRQRKKAVSKDEGGVK